ncbi:U3 small nucleolar RNA-associated protein 6 homolog [Chelonus insularis]|uniref:U3 small nucleolar RNA-associated protein 6 homolog n=1 Tax=Chelonus insularis TaxID=460826 RepID=UPI00158BBD83|nr:U3 small nucleolar RNA-associated protein 6 homolog [Chelonus insularis]
MAEFVEKRCEDMIPELEQMKRIKLFDENEIQEIAKKLKDHEYTIHRHTKRKEDYLKYIKYQMKLLKLVKQRREKFGNTQKKSDIDYSIVNKVNLLYKEAISRFQDDLRFWIAYIEFCKHVNYHSNIDRMIPRMLKIHQDKPKCWHIAARWQIEERKNIQRAKEYLLTGLRFHPESELLFSKIFQLLLNEAESATNTSAELKNSSASASTNDEEIPLAIKQATVIYRQAFKRIKDIDFIINLLNIAKKYKNTKKLQDEIVGDMIKEYSHKPQMWDTMARRELEGLTYDPEDNSNAMEVDTTELASLRERISYCEQVFQAAVKKIKTETMWSMYIDCLLEINKDMTSLPNYKRKLLKSALMQGHQAKKLQEDYYVYWIEMLENDKKDENSQSKRYEVLCNATEALPNSIKLWCAKLKYLFNSDQEELAFSEFNKAIKILGSKALPLWRMKLLYIQVKSPNKVEEFFKNAVQQDEAISREMKPDYIKWLVVTKGIQMARHVYNELSLQPPVCLELHKEMAALELIQPEICKQNARRPHEVAALQFGKNNTEVWIKYIVFEMKYGDPLKVSNIYQRAVKTLNPVDADNFISKYSLIKANPETIESLS